MPSSWQYVGVLLVLLGASIVTGLPELHRLSGVPDFKEVLLKWQYDSFIPDRILAFRIRYCELQFWGQHNCKTKMLNDPVGNEIPDDVRYKNYVMRIDHLRMATNYTFQVTPVAGLQVKVGQGRSTGGLQRTSSASGTRGRALGTEINLQTKGFSAKSSRCLAKTMEIEVETGPNFRGRIWVEGAQDKACSLVGDQLSSRYSYTLLIDQQVCGATVNKTSASLFVVVQEALPILTHSTRRFLVVCTYLPDTFTVRAGVNLPTEDSSENDLGDTELELESIGKSVFEVGAEELFEPPSQSAGNDVLSVQQTKAAQVTAPDPRGESLPAQLVLMVILVIAAVVGVGATVWWCGTGRRIQRSTGSMDPQDSPKVLQYSNMDSVVRDYRRTPGLPPVPSVSLIKVKNLDDQTTLCDCDTSEA